MVETRRLTSLVDSALARADFPVGDVTVALSGGADSAALAHLALCRGGEVRAIHVDHGLPGSPLLAEAARAIASSLSIDLESVSVEIAEGASLEDRARDARYRVLHEVPGPVLTGHTRDDDAETILLNLIRGTGGAGLAGIPPHRAPNVYRPMLDVTRAETREIAALAGLPFHDDPMNDDLRLTRNRLRHRVMPLLAELNPRVVEAIARAGGIVDSDHDYLEALVDDLDGPEALPVALVTTLPGPLADRLLMRMLTRAGLGVTSNRIARIREVAEGTASGHELADGLSVRRDGAVLVVERAVLG